MAVFLLKILPVLLCPFVAASGKLCLRTCEDGQYCQVTECHQCPDRTYQSEGVHQWTFCKDWTTKPPGSHYVKVKNGSHISDAIWRCEDGYEENMYAVGSFECIRVKTTLPTTSSTSEVSTAGKTSPSVLTTISSPPSQVASGHNNDVPKIVVGVVGSVGCVLLAVGFAVFICRRNSKLCFAKAGKTHGVDKINGQATRKLAEVNSTQDNFDGPETELLNPHTDEKCYNFFLNIVENLGDSRTWSFLHVLHDESHTFDLEKVIKSKSKETTDSKIYLTRSLVEWAMVNKPLNMRIIQQALEDVGRPNLLKEILEAQKVTFMEGVCSIDEATDGVTVSYINTFGTGDEIRSAVPIGQKIARSDRFRLYYYLAAWLGESAMALLHQLPDSNNRFSAYEYFKGKRVSGQSDFENAFAESLEEWWQRNGTHYSVRNVLTGFLKDQNRNDILEENEFRSRLEKIDPAQTTTVVIENLEDHVQGC